MLRFAANLSFQYQEYAFLERFQHAAKDGFAGVEYLFPYEYDPAVLLAILNEHSLTQVLFNTPPGDSSRGERGLAALPGREEEFQLSIDLALQYADVLGNKLLHVMAGLIPPGQDRSECRDVFVRNVAYATHAAAAHSVTILIEPINTRDIPGYFLNHQHEAHEICRDVGAPNLKVQADLYHCQIVEGDLATMLKERIDGIGHIQIAGVPERQEPDTGEVNYNYLLPLIDSLGYTGWIGCEYRPKVNTSAGLSWMTRWR
jgi:2-dehydrotetronate isomerase